MKAKILIIALLAVLTEKVNGQTDSNLLTDGRCWHYRVDVVMGDNIATTFNDVFVYGDTVVNDLKCKKVYITSDNDNSTPSTWFAEIGAEGKYHSAWYQDVSKKVYRILRGTTVPVLMFDFGMHVGEKLPNNDNLVYCYDDYIIVSGDIEGTETMVHNYRRMRFAEGDLTDNPKLSDWCLVEGIGGNEGILFAEFQTKPQDGCMYERFMSCSQLLESENHPVFETLFRRDDFNTPSYTGTESVLDIINHKSPATDFKIGLHTLDGRRLTTPPTKGVYIQNGRKVVVK